MAGNENGDLSKLLGPEARRNSTEVFKITNEPYRNTNERTKTKN